MSESNAYCSRFLALILLFLLFPVVSNAESHIRGKVEAATTQLPLENILIRVFSSNWVFIADASVRTISDGSFVSGALNPGTYFLRAVADYPQPYVASYWPSALERDAAQPVTVETNIDTLGIEFSLVKGGFIRGEIQNSHSIAVPNCDLDIYSQEWHWYTSLTAKSDASGEYIIGALPIGRYYLRADPAADRFLQQSYWPQSFYRSSAQLLSIFEGSDISDIDFILSPGGLFSGIVSCANTGVISDCEIIVYDTEWVEQPIHTALTDSSGEYYAFGLPAGSYYAEARPLNGSGCSNQFFEDTLNPSDATLILITEEQSVMGIDFHVAEGNYDINVEIDLPARHFSSGDPFSTSLQIRNDGPQQSAMPVFFLLEFSDYYYFWPSWRVYNPPDSPFIDYAFVDLNHGINQIPIIDTFIWPALDVSPTDVRFLSAVVTRSFTELASDLESISWSFE